MRSRGCNGRPTSSGMGEFPILEVGRSSLPEDDAQQLRHDIGIATVVLTMGAFSKTSALCWDGGRIFPIFRTCSRPIVPHLGARFGTFGTDKRDTGSRLSPHGLPGAGRGS